MNLSGEQTYSLSLYEKAFPDSMPLKSKVKESISLGYDSCEICIDQHPKRQKRLNWSNNEIKDFKLFLEKERIILPTLSLSVLRQCPLGSLDSNKNKEALKIATRAFELGKQLEIGTILINAYDVYDQVSTESTITRFSENIQRIVEQAEKQGVIIGLENAEKDFADSAEKVLYWERKIDSPNLKIYYDPANAYNAFAGSSKKVQHDFELAKGRIVAAHLKDSLPGEYRMTPYGEGQVDFAKIISMMVKAGITQYTAELFFREDRNWKDYTAWVNKFLRKYF